MLSGIVAGYIPVPERKQSVWYIAESPGPIRVDKHGRGPPLAAPIRRIFYLSAEGTVQEHEVFPPPNPRLLAQVESADAIVYGMGSLYTSICPSLVLKVGLPTPRIHPPLLPVPADKSAIRGGVTAGIPLYA